MTVYRTFDSGVPDGNKYHKPREDHTVKKIPTLFRRDPNNRSLVLPEQVTGWQPLAVATPIAVTLIAVTILGLWLDR